MYTPLIAGKHIYVHRTYTPCAVVPVIHLFLSINLSSPKNYQVLHSFSHSPIYSHKQNIPLFSPFLSPLHSLLVALTSLYSYCIAQQLLHHSLHYPTSFPPDNSPFYIFCSSQIHSITPTLQFVQARMSVQYDFSGRVALVTGAGKGCITAYIVQYSVCTIVCYIGIGREISVSLVNSGAKVIAVSRTQSDLDSLIEKVTGGIDKNTFNI